MVDCIAQTTASVNVVAVNGQSRHDKCVTFTAAFIIQIVITDL